MIDCVWFDVAPEGPWAPGMAFPDPYRIEMSKRIVAQLASGERAFPIAVVLPTRGGGVCWFGIDCHPTDEPDGQWQVTIVGELVAGEKPDITVHPSIRAVGLYHGHLTNGVLSDDDGG